MHPTWLGRRSMLPRDRYISHDGLGQEATLYTSLMPTSQQTTNCHKPSAQSFPSHLHRFPGEFPVQFLQHLYGTGSSAMLRSTGMFVQEAHSVSGQDKAQEHCLQIRNKKTENKKPVQNPMKNLQTV